MPCPRLHPAKQPSPAQVEDLKGRNAQYAEKVRKMDATLAELRQQAEQQQQQQAAAAPVAAEPGSAPHQQQQQAQDRRVSAEQPATSQRPKDGGARSSGYKRRQSGGSLGTAGGADTGGGAAASPAADAVDAGAEPAGAAAPLLHPALLAAAAGMQRAALLDQLMAACSASMAVLTGAAPSSLPRSPSADDAGAGATTALLLRSRLAAAAAAPDSESLQFTAAFVRRVQQVACGLLAPPALLDSIAALAASSLAQLHGAARTALPPQRVQLIAAGLHVAQHLLALDASCHAAASHLPGSSSSSGGGSFVAAAQRGLSSRVTISGSSLATQLAAPAARSLLGLGSSSTDSSGAGLPATEAVLLQHAPVFAAFGSAGGPLLPVLLGAALSLGPQHEAVAAGALGSLLELARALQGAGARAALEPVFTSGGWAAGRALHCFSWIRRLAAACACPCLLLLTCNPAPHTPCPSSGTMELLMQPPALRVQALQLLQLLLEDASLAQLFEGSLSQAAAARGEPGPPTATAGTGGSGGTGEGGGTSHTPGRSAAPGCGDNGVQPMQPDDSEAGGPWIGAAAISERLLESFVLSDGPAPTAAAGPSGGSAKGGSAAAADLAASAAEPACGSSTAMPRAALQLVAALREQRQRGILAALLLDDACGAPGLMLAQRLVQLADAALALPGEEAALQLLCPLQWPARVAGGGGGGGTLLHQQAAWQQRLRLAQEALTLLRGLLVDSECSE